jgi:hypothetical protein
VLLLVFGLKPVDVTAAVNQQEVLSFDQLLRHTRLSVNPYIPSAWLAKSVLSWSEGLTLQGAFFFLLLLSNALMGLLIGFVGMGRLFYGSWTVSLSSRAERFSARRRRSGSAGIAGRCSRWRSAGSTYFPSRQRLWC